MGPTLLHPQLWHLSRRGVALGVGLGIFFGFLIPLAQIPVAAVSATLLRANVPTAIASTLVTNPVTFAPIYVIAYKLGNKLLGQKLDPKSLEQVAKGVTPQENTPETESSDNNSSIQKILNVRESQHGCSGIMNPQIFGTLPFAPTDFEAQISLL